MNRKSMGTYFVFLEIKDIEVLNLLISLRQVFLGKTSNSAIHLTVRGPYEVPPLSSQIRKWQEMLRDEPVVLANTGFFSNRDEYVVYIKISNEYLRQIWYKPDFPVKEYGFNPHITLYKGGDLERAKKIEKFLKSENIELMCYEYELNCYKSKDMKLFGPKEMDQKHHFKTLVDLGKVKYDILNRAMSLMDDFTFLDVCPTHKNPYEKT